MVVELFHRPGTAGTHNTTYKTNLHRRSTALRTQAYTLQLPLLKHRCHHPQQINTSTMRSTRALWAQRQPLIKFLGKRHTPKAEGTHTSSLSTC